MLSSQYDAEFGITSKIRLSEAVDDAEANPAQTQMISAFVGTYVD